LCTSSGAGCHDAIIDADKTRHIAAQSSPGLLSRPVPTLIVPRTGDANTPIDTSWRRTAALVPKAQDKEYGNAAHGLYMIHADQLNADLPAFIKS
jgi:pimeloyl-ACP methyl ester carboxylesterase